MSAVNRRVDAMNKSMTAAIAVAGLVAAVGAYLWSQREAPAPTTFPPVVSTAAAPPTATEPTIKHPIEPLAQGEPVKQSLPTLDRSDAMVRATVTDWLGRESVQALLQLDDFVRHVVVTVDNLARSHAAPRLWPVTPMPGRYTVMEVDDTMHAAPVNAERYAPFVAFVERVDTKQAVALYARWYPLFQQAYEELGYPGHYFNDRLIEVIDQLIATPVPAQPLELKITEVKGPIPATQPWLRYEFADQSLEALSAGQKMLLRMGPAHQQRLNAKLVELRRQLSPRAVPR
jgi:hypothetical protein